MMISLFVPVLSSVSGDLICLYSGGGGGYEGFTILYFIFPFQFGRSRVVLIIIGLGFRL